ncbi:MAG: ribosomal protein L13e [Thaumarchaeota archaeon]|nr:ribosomal protein L13e [Nitrososphaerota archaeon]
MSVEEEKPKRKPVRRTTRSTKTTRAASKAKKKEEKQKVQFKPQGEAPTAIVVRKHHMLVKQRVGRGFSLGELKAVGLSVELARRLKLKVDERRSSAHRWNIEALQQYLGLSASR